MYVLYIYKRLLYKGLKYAICYLSHCSENLETTLNNDTNTKLILLAKFPPNNLDNLLDEEIQHNDILFCCISKPNFFQ